MFHMVREVLVLSKKKVHLNDPFLRY
jgi:hypothetical protein